MKQIALYFGIVLLLCYTNFYLFFADPFSWITISFCISGLVATYFFSKGVILTNQKIRIWIETKNKNLIKNVHL